MRRRWILLILAAILVISTLTFSATAAIPKGGSGGHPLSPEVSGERHELAYTWEYAVKTYQESPHGKAAALGREGIPTCTDCHGQVDWMYFLPQSDPRSPINPKNRAAICAREECHGIEVNNAAKGSMHGGDIYSIGSISITGLINRFYKILIPLVLGFFTIFAVLDFTRKLGKRWKRLGKRWKRG